MGTLEHRNLDQANYHLEKGLAGIKEAEAYVKLWNETRFTKAELIFRKIRKHGIIFETPQIIIYES